MTPDQIVALQAELDRQKALNAELHAGQCAGYRDLLDKARRLEGAILWALGESGAWPEKQPDEGAFYWRKELRRRASLGP